MATERRHIKQGRMGKKGSLVDIVFISVIFFAFTITCLIGYAILQMYNEQTSLDPNLSNESKAITGNAQASYGAIFDGVMIFMLVGCAVALIVSVMVIQTHPGFLWVSLFLMIIFSVLFFIMQESWKTISEDTTFVNMTNATAQFPITGYIMNNYLNIFIIIGVLGIIVMYAKFGGGWN